MTLYFLASNVVVAWVVVCCCLELNWTGATVPVAPVTTGPMHVVERPAAAAIAVVAKIVALPTVVQLAAPLTPAALKLVAVVHLVGHIPAAVALMSAGQASAVQLPSVAVVTVAQQIAAVEVATMLILDAAAVVVI